MPPPRRRTYTLTDLGNLSGSNVSNVAGTANVGGSQVVVGTAAGTAWFWDNGTMTSLASVLTTLSSSSGNGAYSGSNAMGVNSAGQIVGTYSAANVSVQPFAVTINGAGSVLSSVNIKAQTSTGYYSNFGNLNANSVSSNGLTFGVAFAGGINPTQYTLLANANGSSFATNIGGATYTTMGGINASGWTTAKDSPDCMVWNGSTFTDIGELSTFGSYGYGLDAVGDVVGKSGLPGGNATFKTAPYYVPYLGGGTWGTMVNLGNLSGFQSGLLYGGAYAINNGTIVGYATTGVNPNPTNAYAWVSGTTAGTMTAYRRWCRPFPAPIFPAAGLASPTTSTARATSWGLGYTPTAPPKTPTC